MGLLSTPFNNILNPLCALCITKISLPTQFHSISIFLYYLAPAGLTSASGPVIYVPLVVADGSRYTSSKAAAVRLSSLKLPLAFTTSISVEKTNSIFEARQLGALAVAAAVAISMRFNATAAFTADVNSIM